MSEKKKRNRERGNGEGKGITVMDMFDEWYKTTPLELETKRGYKSALNQVPAIHNRKPRASRSSSGLP